MAHCKVTVQGRTIELEADSLYRCILKYHCGTAAKLNGYDGLPLLALDEEVEVESGGRIYRATLALAMKWANAQVEGRLGK